MIKACTRIIACTGYNIPIQMKLKLIFTLTDHSTCMFRCVVWHYAVVLTY